MTLSGSHSGAEAARNPVIVKLKDCTAALLQRARVSGFTVRYVGQNVEFGHLDPGELDRFRSFIRSQRRPS